VILFLSRLHPKKGLDHLLTGLEIISSRAFSVVVAGTGSPEYEARLRGNVDRSSLKGRVHFVGFAQGDFKQLLLQGADLFALTSHSESLGIAAMEAMAAGTPILVTPAVPLALLVEKFDTGWVTSLDRRAIASALVAALDLIRDDPDTARARRQRCRHLAANFEWQQMAMKMELVYQAIQQHRAMPSFELAAVTLIPADPGR
jgi:glycosyltransferase involved in cell wall biosynthesis